MARHATRRSLLPHKLGGPESPKLPLNPVQFRQAFEHLRDAPLVVFVGEFIIRNPKFLADCKHFDKLLSDEGEEKGSELAATAMLAKKYGAWVPNWRKVINRKEWIKIKLLPGVRGFRVVDSSQKEVIRELLEKKRSKFASGESETAALFHVRDTSLNSPETEDLSTVSEKLAALDFLLGGNHPVDGKYPFDDYLLLSIDLNRPKGEILETIGRYMDVHHDPKRTFAPFRKEDWIRYLMVFDLRAHWKMSWEKISEFLAEAFPEKKRSTRRSRWERRGPGRPPKAVSKPPSTDENRFEEQGNIRRDFREAKRLIFDGNYMKFLRYSQLK